MKILAPILQEQLAQGSFWSGLVGDAASVDQLAAEIAAESGTDAGAQQLNIDLTTLLDDFKAEGLSSGVSNSAHAVLKVLLTEMSKLDEATQRILAQTDFPAAGSDWRVPTAEQIMDTPVSSAAASSEAGASTDPSGQASAAAGAKAGRPRVDTNMLDSARDPAAALYAEELRDGRDSDLFPRDPNFRAPIPEADDEEYLSDVDDQEDNWVKFRTHKTETLAKALEGGGDGTGAEDDAVLDPALHLPGGEQGDLAEGAEAPLPEVLGHSRSYKTHHFRMLEAVQNKDLTEVFAQWTLNAQRAQAPDYLATHIMLDAAACAGAAEVFAYVMDDLMSRHGQMTAETYKVAIKAAGILGNLPVAEAAFKALVTQERHTPDIHAYTPVIAAAVRSGDVGRAFKWFNRMRHQGLRPSDTVFGLLVAGAAAATPATAPTSVLWNAMKLHHIVAVSTDTWHALLDAFTAAATPDAEALWEAYTCMAHPRWFGGPCTPDAQRMCDVFNSLVASHMYDEARRLQTHMADAGMFASKAINAQEIKDVVAGFPAAGTYATAGAAQWMAQPNAYGQPYLPEDAAHTEELLAAAEEQMAAVGGMSRLQGADVKDYPWDRQAAQEAAAAAESR
jgi:pentatricopeptide repeat protein